MPLPWFSPEPRAVIPVGQVHVSRSLRRRVARCGWTTTVDTAFADVVVGCASPRADDDGTWVTPEMRDAYQALHALGWAHSVEVWDGDELVGGLYFGASGVRDDGTVYDTCEYHPRQVERIARRAFRLAQSRDQ